MESEPSSQNRRSPTDRGSHPFCTHIPSAARRNPNFRTAFWTGSNLQMTLMCIPVRGDIGVEIHPDTDQLIRVEGGRALIRMGSSRDGLNHHCFLNPGGAVFIPCGTWHNVMNAGSSPLHLSSIYAPPHHPRGTVHRTRSDAGE